MHINMSCTVLNPALSLSPKQNKYIETLSRFSSTNRRDFPGSFSL